jgi:hypothetical protein
MEGYNRTDFLKPKDLDREPNEPNLANPEIANWAEIDPELRNEVIDSFNKSLDRNKHKPNTIQRLVRVAAILGILGGGLTIDKNFNESKIQDGAKDIAHSLIDAAGQEYQQSIEQKEAVTAMEAQKNQEEAKAQFDQQVSTDAASEKEALANSQVTSEIPQTVLNQNFDGLDTTKIE